MVHPSRVHDPRESNSIDDGFNALEKKVVDTIRCLAMDSVQKANSGHPGIEQNASCVGSFGFKLFHSFSFFIISFTMIQTRNPDGHGTCCLHNLVQVS